MDVQAAPHQVPTIDLTDLHSGRRSDLEAIGRLIGDAARSIGFFSIVNHGLERNVAEVLAEANRFFALPLEAKERVELQSYFCGYTRLDREHGEPHEAFDIGPDIAPDDPGVLAGTSLFAPRRWPELSGFRERLSAYYDAGTALIVQLHRAIALDLGADVEYFTPFFPHMVNLRMLHYPPHPAEREGWGISPHTDFGNLTLLAQDNHGLELRALDGTWLPTEVRPDALMCNIGDCLMRWSNDTYISTPHRVRNTTGVDRHSVALFGDVNGDALVSCMPSCEREDRPAKYPPIRFADFARSRFESGYGAA
jgi:isopenicillin N synthase-like dioxygenase